ncbi:hypothetical protein [Burkholderia sp. RS02]|uniref:hypothetical protein n=1 Tax=unclassified Burkholderia TaxID=2613784 RepID=UPI0032187748
MVTDLIADMTLTAMVAESVARCRSVGESGSVGRFSAAATANAVPNAHRRSPHRCRRSRYRAAAVGTSGPPRDDPKALDKLRAARAMKKQRRDSQPRIAACTEHQAGTFDACCQNNARRIQLHVVH